MKKIILFSLLALTLIYLSLPNKQDAAKAFKIAILTPTSHPSLEQIEKGFKDTLTADVNYTYSIRTYNAHGNKTLMRSEMEEIVHQNYDLIFAIGAQASQMSREVIEKNKLHIPIVFTAVSYPTLLHLHESTLMTGIEQTVDFKQQLAILKRLKPDIQKIVLVYDPTQFGMQQDKDIFVELASKAHIYVVPVEVFKSNEIAVKTTPFLAQADAVFVLKDNTVVPGLDTLVKLCKAHHVVLVACDLDSVDRGAGFAFGTQEYAFGSEGALKARAILVEGKQPKDLPISPVPSYAIQAKYNNAALKELGILAFQEGNL